MSPPSPGNKNSRDVSPCHPPGYKYTKSASSSPRPYSAHGLGEMALLPRSLPPKE